MGKAIAGRTTPTWRPQTGRVPPTAHAGGGGTAPPVSDRPVACPPGVQQYQAPHSSPFQNLGTFCRSLSALRAPATGPAPAPGTGLGARGSPGRPAWRRHPPRPARRAAGVPCAGGRWRPGESRCTRPAPRRLAAPHRLPATHARGDLAPDTQNPTRRQDLLQPRPWSPGGPSGGPGRGKLSGPIRAGGVRGEASPLPWTAPGQGYFSPSCILRTKDRDRQAGRVTD